MTEDKLEIAIQNGIRARQLLESEIFQLIIKNLKDHLLREWANEGDRDYRDILWHKHWAMINLEKELQGFVSNGKVAERQLKENG